MSRTVMFDVTNPADGSVIGSLPTTEPGEIRGVVDASRAAQRAWAATPAHERVGLIRSFAAAIRAESGELATTMSAEVGKIVTEAEAEVEVCARLLEGYANEYLHARWHAFPGNVQPGMEDDLVIVTREPLGVVGAILPFNFPLDLFAHKVGPSLSVGNTVIVKPAHDAPLAVQRAVEIAHEVGIPDDVLQVIHGSGSKVGGALVTADVDAISFTGSAPVGIDIAEQRSRRLTPTLLELGANDAAVVLDDADVDLAVESILFSRLLVNGQCCCATKRVIATPGVADRLIELLADHLDRKKMGDQLDRSSDIGPMITAEAAAQAASEVAEAIAGGAVAVRGSASADGAFLSPVLLADVPATSRIATDLEVFAPVIPVIRAGSPDEAVSIANSAPFGLNASVFSEDTRAALDVTRRLEAGSIAVNGAGLFRVDAAPFGGVKNSGLGREGFTVSLEELTRPKTISLRGYWR